VSPPTNKPTPGLEPGTPSSLLVGRPTARRSRRPGGRARRAAATKRSRPALRSSTGSAARPTARAPQNCPAAASSTVPSVAYGATHTGACHVSERQATSGQRYFTPAVRQATKREGVRSHHRCHALLVGPRRHLPAPADRGPADLAASLSASIRICCSERSTVRSHGAATRSPHHRPSAHRSVPSSPW
jgi:hypothetical protein